MAVFSDCHPMQPTIPKIGVIARLSCGLARFVLFETRFCYDSEYATSTAHKGGAHGLPS